MHSLKNKYRALGIMSGTSLDGLDMAICEFHLHKNKWNFRIEHFKTIAYTKELYGKLYEAYKSSAAEIAELNTAFGNFIGQAAKSFLLETDVKVDLIASHGHTIFHVPVKGYTYQIGNGAEIAAQSGVTTICDFRSLDIARGGQGAPLVPIGDKLLFSEYAACLNLGGFANISFDVNKERLVAYDICPVNFVLNRLANRVGLPFDSEGFLARSGELDKDLFKLFNENKYYMQNTPKSLGQEWVEANVLPLLSSNFDNKDILRTYTEHVAFQISCELNKVEGAKVLVTGGGVYNKFLLELISSKCNKQLFIPSPELIEMKEAMVFAFLGVLRLRGEVNSLASVTGAEADSCNGAIYSP
jgi:anhydro-N-acetylmuramic acid kinase